MFCNLKFYSEYSLNSGILKIKEILENLKADNQKCICITDKNNISSSIKSNELSKLYNIKNIIGVETYIHDKKNSIFGNITILVKNKKGYDNICNIINKSWKNFSLFKKKFVNLKFLKKNQEGLIFFSGGKKSFSKGIFFENDFSKLYKRCNTIFKFIEKKNFLIEIQRFNKETFLESEKLINISYKKKIPLIATNPNFFFNKEERLAYETKICIKKKIKYKNMDKNKFKYHKFLTKKKASFIFKDVPSALINTISIEKKCNFKYKKKNRYPKFYKKNSYKILKKKLYKIFKLKKLSKKYLNTLKHEIYIIKKTNFSSFFLIVEDIVCWAKKKNIQVGPGRGSSSSSLVAYLLKITDVDPIKNNLLFERFLNKNKNCLPDFDIDFSPKYRNIIIEYIKKKYGKNNVINIVTFGKFALKNSFRDSGRIFGLKYNEIEKKIKERGVKKKIFYLAAKNIENRIRNIGIHAGGIIIYDNKINKLPFFLINKKKGNFVKTSQFDKCDIENLGFLKLDILGLKTLNVIENIKKESKFKKNFSDLDFKDKKTFKLICKGQTNGIFQLESYGIKKLLLNIKPKKFNDLVSILALYRPGPMYLINKFCLRRKKKYNKYISKEIKNIIGETYGIIIFQEQIIKIISECYNISINKAEELRKFIYKNINNEQIIKNVFLNKIKKKYRNNEKEIFNMIVKFSGYGFNKAHAVSYAIITYYMAFLKKNFFKNFIVANINCFISDSEKTDQFIKEAKKKKIFFLKPDLNKSYYKFKKKNNNILFGLGGIKNLGKKASIYIEIERKRRKFKNFYDFFFRMDKSIVNKRKIESLIFSNVFTNNIKKKVNYLNFLKKKIPNNVYQLRIFDNFIKKKVYITFKKKIFFMKKEYYHLGTFIKNPMRKFINEIKKIFYKIKLKYKFNFNYIGYIEKIFKINNGQYLIIVTNNLGYSKSFFVKENLCKKLKKIDIVIILGFFYKNRIFIKNIKKIK
ncbi:DNA polymerase III subunit alpha [Candidatus Vidania fulgoroideae]|nr:DNA polymerase III subunit alpha [Candidatus Vidania fulgoroideae]